VATSDAERFNPYHAKAGSSAGGQFSSSSGGGGGKGAAKSPGGHAAPPPGGSHDAAHTPRERLLAQAHADRERARELEKELRVLEHQEHAAAQAAKHHAAQAAAAKKAGKPVHHHHHAALHRHHHHHAATLRQRITHLKTEIHHLREHAADLEKQAHVTRAAGEVTNPKGTERLHEYWVHGEGAAKIRWGQPNDFARCVEHLGKFIKDPKGYCNLAHKAALGFYPATHAAMEKKAAGRSQVTEPAYDADGLDGSWDGDCSDLPDLTGLDVSHFEAADGSTETAPASRAARLGSGARFKKLKASLAAKGARDPGALAAHIGRKKYGKAKFMKLASKARGSSRGETDDQAEDVPLVFSRDFPLEDISIRAGGDGRTVTAYATVFDTPVPIHDQQGDYIEIIDRHAFDRILPKLRPQADRKAWRVGVFYNHGMTLHGTASDRNSVPIGVPLEVTADARGLKTVTRYHRGELADQILEAIREGSLGAYSFSGRFDQSRPSVPRGGFRASRQGSLPTVVRMESTLREFGPTPFPAYHDAVITGVRADKIAEQLQHITELIRSGAPLDSPQFPGASPDENSPTDDLLAAEGEVPPEGTEHSARYHQHALYVLRAKEAREKAGLVW